MSKIIRTRKPSVLPYYAAALAFVVLCAVLPVYRLWALLAALGAAVLAFAGAKKICPPRVSMAPAAVSTFWLFSAAKIASGERPRVARRS